jgi:nucleoside-diphosphate-sugar epimerase
MKILVTGINGRLGMEIARLAAERGHEIIGISRRGWPTDQPLPSGVRNREIDTADLEGMKALMEGCEAFIHTSGLHGAHLKSHSLGDFLDINVTQVGKLVSAAHSVGITRVCLSSTLQVHCGYTQRASGSMIIEESMPSRADTSYSISKCAMEILGREMARVFGLSIVSLRLGAFGYLKDAELGPKLLNLSISLTDAARAAYHGVEKIDLQGEAVIIAPSSPFTQSDILEGIQNPSVPLEKHYPGATAILEREGLPIEPAQYYSVCSIRRAKLLLGWTPHFTFESWLRLKGWQPPA